MGEAAGPYFPVISHSEQVARPEPSVVACEMNDDYRQDRQGSSNTPNTPFNSVICSSVLAQQRKSTNTTVVSNLLEIIIGEHLNYKQTCLLVFI